MLSRLIAIYGLIVFVAVLLLGAILYPRTGQGRLFLFAGFCASAAALPAFAVARWFNRPVRELNQLTKWITEGAYGHKVYSAMRGEFGTLARSFNAMSERLAEQFAQVEEDRQQLRTILGGMVEGVVAIDDEQRILFANERAVQLLEFHPQAAIGRRFWEVVRQRAILDVVDRVLAEGGPHREEFDWHGASVRNLALYAARLPGKTAQGAIIVLHDTSDLRRLERLRSEFVANVSHELKTPLAVIKMCAETLLDGARDDPEARHSFLKQIDEEAEQLHKLILDLLSLARIESGEEMVELIPVSVAQVVRESLERHRPRAEAKHQSLEAEPPPIPTEITAWTDDDALGHILDNLVDNAVKYTPEGGSIRVAWTLENGSVRLDVSDTGIGIPERDQPRIFERFYRVDKARSREMGGTGLGLSIVKHLCQIVKGSIAVRSEVGRGTTFTVRLPAAPQG